MLAGTRGALKKGWQTGSGLIKGEFGNTVLPITGKLIKLISFKF